MADARSKDMLTIMMESNYEDLGDISTEMKCTICTRILINAQSAPCGCRYCLGCVQAYLNGERRFCAGNMDDCRLEMLDIDSNIHPDQAMNNKISKLVVACRYSCGSRCELRNMEDHERVCRKQPVNCPYANVGCTETQLVSDRINEHLVGENGAHATLLMACIDRLRAEISSLKNDSGELRSEMALMKLVRDVDKARTNEKMDRIEQEVANLRIENKLMAQENSSLRAEMERHRDEHLAHVAGTKQQIVELRARVETQARDIELLGEKCNCSEEKFGEIERQAREEKDELRQNIDLMREEQASGQGELKKRVREMGANAVMKNWGQYEWRIDGWAAKSQSAKDGICKVIFSDAFYSHENGYKMCLSVWPDGDGVGMDTHLAVYFHLMRGPFDNFLSWPFKRAVTLSLIDQHTGFDHASRTRTFDDLPNNIDWNRPASERNKGFGTSNLLELVALSSTAGLIEDDTIFIRCVVKDVTSNEMSRIS